mgnify:CR=1 FL=1
MRLRRLRASYCIARDSENHPSLQARRKTCITWARWFHFFCVRLDAKACRATFAFNKHDHEIYEHAHRLFCSRLDKAGLSGDEAVETELSSSNLCGALDFSKVDDVCGRLETRDVLLKKAAHDARCAHRGPGATPRIELSEGLFSRLRGA